MYNLKYYLVVVECGHVGAGKCLEVTRYFQGYNLVSTYLSTLYMPRSKKKTDSIKLIKEISYEEYVQGKKLEKENSYLNITKNKTSLYG